MSVEIGIEAEFDFAMDANDDASKLFDRLMAELVALVDSGCGITDPAVSVDLEKGQAVVELVAAGDSFDDAVALADSSVRTAAHAAGWNTAGWEVTKQSQRAELVDL